MKTYKFKIGSNPYTVEIASIEGGVAKVNVNGIDYEVEIEDAPASAPAAASAGTASVTSSPAPTSTSSPAPTGDPTPAKKVCSPLPGVILSVNVAVGDKVKAGDKVAVLEAMKMENDIEAESDGTITAIHVQKGDSVLEGAAIVSLA